MDVKNDVMFWIEFFLLFLELDNCFNFVKVDIEWVKEKEKEFDDFL